MAIKVADNFSYLGAKPLDARLQFATVADMVASPVATLYDGCFAYVKGTKKYYSFDSTNDVDATLGKWREYENGGSGVKSVYYGYLKEADGKFYADSAYTTEIAGATDTLYVAVDTDKTYRYDSTNGFVLVGGDGETIQYDTMPTASSSLVGTIVQYVGSTTATYTKGYWYECVLDGATYKWQNIQVQEGGGESGSGISVTATLLAASWDAQNQQTVTFTGYQASMNGVIGVPASATDAQKEAYASALVRTVAQNGNQFTFECESIPSIDLPVTIYAGGSSGSGTGGHTIIDDAGQSMTSRDGLQFVGATVTDDSVGNKTVITIPAIQYSTMPTADADHLGNIVQYIGEDTSTLTNGFFYKCVSDEEETPTYSWVEYNTQKKVEVRADGTALAQRDALNFTDFDLADDSTDEETDITPHRLTAGEMTDIMSTLPGAPTDLPVMFDERGTEYQVGWYVLSNGTKKPVYQKTFSDLGLSPTYDTWVVIGNIPYLEYIIDFKILGHTNNSINLTGAGLEVFNDGGVIKVEYNQSANVRTIDIFVVQFTKTTDTPIPM